METCLSKWKALGCLLISICILVLSSTSSDAAVKTYTLSIDSAASVVHTSGGITGGGMGDLSISGTFQAVVTNGVIEFHDIDVTTSQPDGFNAGSRIVPSYTGTATQTGTSLMLSGSKSYDNSTGGGNFNGVINGTTFSMSGNFNAPCCDQYNYQFVLGGTVVSDGGYTNADIGLPACSRNAKKTVTLKGTGQSSWIERQITTKFTVVGNGCIVDWTDSSVSVTPGAVLQFDAKVGKGPQPSYGTWQGVKISTDSHNTIKCPTATGDVGQLYLNNFANHGKDEDTLTITVATY
jgi:hypothetical protein